MLKRSQHDIIFPCCSQLARIQQMGISFSQISQIVRFSPVKPRCIILKLRSSQNSSSLLSALFTAVVMLSKQPIMRPLNLPIRISGGFARFFQSSITTTCLSLRRRPAGGRTAVREGRSHQGRHWHVHWSWTLGGGSQGGYGRRGVPQCQLEKLHLDLFYLLIIMFYFVFWIWPDQWTFSYQLCQYVLWDLIGQF